MIRVLLATLLIHMVISGTLFTVIATVAKQSISEENKARYEQLIDTLDQLI